MELFLEPWHHKNLSGGVNAETCFSYFKGRVSILHCQSLYLNSAMGKVSGELIFVYFLTCFGPAVKVI